MSVTTTADEHRDTALEEVDSALRHLAQIVVYQCNGANEYSKEYTTKLSESFSALMKIRGDLDVAEAQ